MLRYQILFYLVATAWNYPDIRLYAMHRITKASRTYESGQKPIGFCLDKFLESGALHFGSGKAIKLEAHIKDYLARVLFETPLATDQIIEGDILTATVQDTWQLRWWILSQGDAFKVMGPITLRHAIRASLANALARYDFAD